MNKNLLFLTLILAITANDVLPAGRIPGGRKQKYKHNAQKQAAQAHEPREQLIQTTNQQHLYQVLELCLAVSFNEATTLIHQKGFNINALLDSRGNRMRTSPSRSRR